MRYEEYCYIFRYFMYMTGFGCTYVNLSYCKVVRGLTSQVVSFRGGLIKLGPLDTWVSWSLFHLGLGKFPQRYYLIYI